MSYVWCHIVSTIFRLKNWVEKVFGYNFMAKNVFFTLRSPFFTILRKFSFFGANIFRNWISSYVWCCIVTTIYRLKNWVEKVFGDNFVAKNVFYAKITIFHYLEKILTFLRKYLSQLDFELRMMLYSYYNLSVKKMGWESVWWQFCGKKGFFMLKSQFFTILRKFSLFCSNIFRN